MSAVTSRLIFVFLFTLNCILWARGRYGQFPQASSVHSEGSLVKRIAYELSHPGGVQATYSEKECRPLAFPIDSQCTHVQADCEPPDTVLNINYQRHYFCTDTTLRPLVFAGLVVWLIFLFSTLGISASDFFTPNLATIAQLLGLDENVAGVTFLAFGNGSPDLFSTFSAMRANSGSLALGELLGAATFIVSCVVGSMCIIKPFQVNRGPFLRDVGFFTAAVLTMLIILWDGKISSSEAASLVILYLIYVVVVVIGSWYSRRQERRRLREAVVREEYAEGPLFQPYTDQPIPTLVVPSTSNHTRAVPPPNPPRVQTNLTVQVNNQMPSPTSPFVGQLPSFSLIGALEFREVVASLQKQASATSLGLFESPLTPYAGGHYHSQALSRSHSRSPRSSLASSVDAEAVNALQLDERTNSDTLSPLPRHQGRLELLPESDDYFAHASSGHRQSVPSILRTPASPISVMSDSEGELQLFPQTRRQRLCACLRRICHTLFPTLHHFKSQSALGKIACLFAAPAVLCLTLTLPVVVTPYDVSRSSREKTHGDGRLIDFEEEGVERVLIAEEEVEEEMHGLSFSKWLLAAQCILGPLFAARVLFGGTKHELWILIAALVCGMIAAALVIAFCGRQMSPAARMIGCSMGFIVAIIWIMAIADEVVNVLKTFGLIYGLSDAIIGLTIFAVGNSLADLVANMSVAVFAPIMGFSACFGGPMLNILLGVGISGSYINSQTSQPYILHLSTTLFVSCFGLLFLLAATLIFVPLNGYFLSRRWGILLIATYTVIMIVNLIVELKS